MAIERVRRLSIQVRHLILQYAAALLSTVRIQRVLEKTHNIKTSRQAIRKFLDRFKRSGSVTDLPKRRRNGNITNFHRQMMNLWLSKNCELTSRALRDKIMALFGLKLSSSCVSKIRRKLGWTTQRVKYCQLISHQNKLKRLQWCLAALERKDTFEDVIFTDESTIEMSSNGKLFFYLPSSNLQRIPAKRQKPKHAYKVHIWAGISYRGRTDCCVFTGIMDSITYQQILERNFLPFVARKFPDGYRLYQDNDSKHKSKSTKAWMTQKNMLNNVMECPASSPDINVVEKTFLQVVITMMREIIQYNASPFLGVYK
ncbi:unnamed protein product [Mytilus edulis]|uniref:Tc1-like transposase DDE domain-containing protein n=1 Tax=Mytilus edulis TaxID=6550 RepID=A0A8S3UHW5_MYTED|nr:unnamed protein product [Mytilus edulis]